MIEYVTREKATWAEVPHKFEAGTVSAGDAVGMAAAIRYIQSIGLENIEAHDRELAQRMMAGITQIPHINIIGPKDASKRCGIITFTLTISLHFSQKNILQFVPAITAHNRSASTSVRQPQPAQAFTFTTPKKK